MGAEKPDKGGQEAGVAQNMGVHGHILGAVNLLPIGKAHRAIPIGLIVTERLNADQQNPDKAGDEAQQHHRRAAFIFPQAGAEGFKAAIKPAAALKRQEGQGRQKSQGQSRQIGGAFQPPNTGQHQGQRQNKQQDSQHDLPEKTGHSFHGRSKSLLFFSRSHYILSHGLRQDNKTVAL